jgi:hypothetical protein
LCLVVILAGYKDRMDVFYQSNPGLASRIANHIHFPDYSAEELLQIGEIMLSEQQYRITEEGKKIFLQYIELRKKQPLFANARSIKNAILLIIQIGKNISFTLHANMQIYCLKISLVS